MKFSNDSSDLEQLVSRIHRLIEPEGATVTWNKTLSDPDTGQLRQIDGVIERGGKRIHVECRDHKGPQNVQWVEELIGRRQSLNADSIIGVSTAGFTKPAVDKAAAHGVILRELSAMTDKEIASWGNYVNISSKFVQLKELKVTLRVPGSQIANITAQPELRIPGERLHPVILILDNLTREAHDSFFPDRDTRLNAEVNLENLFIDTVPVLGCKVFLRGKLTIKEVAAIAIWKYDGIGPSALPSATVEKIDLGNTELIRSDQSAAMLLDLTCIDIPDGHYLHSWTVDMKSRIRTRIESVGSPSKLKFNLPFRIRTEPV